ncbi:MAG: hypothetical protein GY861_04670 [bacterium]|nr:hypothetical protein [bacterium]
MSDLKQAILEAIQCCYDTHGIEVDFENGDTESCIILEDALASVEDAIDEHLKSKSDVAVFDKTKLDQLAPMISVVRQYYGDDKDNPPNTHCYWDSGDFSRQSGWWENDEHLRMRVKVHLS